MEIQAGNICAETLLLLATFVRLYSKLSYVQVVLLPLRPETAFIIEKTVESGN